MTMSEKIDLNDWPDGTVLRYVIGGKEGFGLAVSWGGKWVSLEHNTTILPLSGFDAEDISTEILYEGM